MNASVTVCKPDPNGYCEYTSTDTNGAYGFDGLFGNVTVRTLPKYGSPRASDHNANSAAAPKPRSRSTGAACLSTDA